MQTKEVLSDN